MSSGVLLWHCEQVSILSEVTPRLFFMLREFVFYDFYTFRILHGFVITLQLIIILIFQLYPLLRCCNAKTIRHDFLKGHHVQMACSCRVPDFEIVLLQLFYPSSYLSFKILISIQWYLFVAETCLYIGRYFKKCSIDIKTSSNIHAWWPINSIA